MSTILSTISSFRTEISSGMVSIHRETPTIIVDRCELFREGLKDTLIDSDFMVIASSGRLADIHISNIQVDTPPLIIIAASGNLAEDVAAIKVARAQFPTGTTVSLCRDCQPQHAAALFREGVGAILLMPSRLEGFIKALELAMLGQRVVPLHLMECCINCDQSKSEEISTHGSSDNFDKLSMKLSRLSAREVEIVQCLLAGEPNRSIAQRLVISEATVKVHVKAILRKINVKNRTQAAIWASSNMTSSSMFVGTGPMLS